METFLYRLNAVFVYVTLVFHCCKDLKVAGFHQKERHTVYIHEGDVLVKTCFKTDKLLNNTRHAWRKHGANHTLKHNELHIANTSAGDTGIYECVDLNTSSVILEMDLHEMYAPIPDSTTPIKTEFGVPVSSNVTLTFYADAVPIPNASGYTWSRCINTTERKQIANSSDVERSMVYRTLVENDKFTIQSKGLISKLTLLNITIIDYGEYKLTVQNGIGRSWEQSYTIWREGRPSMPSEFAIVAGSATHSSVVVSWKGGSNGGSRQTFQVEYAIVEPNKEVFHVSVEDTEQENENATLTQLSSNTEYTVKMTSSNIHGTSGYTDEKNFRMMQGPIKTYTRMASVSIMASSASGGALLLVSVVLLIVCIRRRKTSSDTTRGEQDVYSHYEIADRVNLDRMISAETHGTGNGNGFNSSTNEQQDIYYLHPQHQQPYETPIDGQDIYSHYATADTTNMDKSNSSAKCIIL